MLKRKCLFVLLITALMSSCISNKQLIVFKTVTAETAEEINKTMKPQPEPRVKINDALIITVSALDPEAVIPYNLPTVSYESPTSSTVPTSSSFQYYTVDEQGYIDFPILGLPRLTERAWPVSPTPPLHSRGVSEEKGR